ncbi:MAG: glutathione S-transferase family protein, partial [Rhodospirillaceae bacterium]|nr:glutathione S-transferase family protein [Rhodospirillaceae bacterium]
KTYIYHKSVGRKMAHSEVDDQRYRSLQKNPDLLEFHRKSTNEGFSDEEIARAETTLNDSFAEMEVILDRHDWLVGDRFSLADIAWVPLQFTLSRLARYEFGSLPNVADWTRRLSARNSYQNGIVKWWPPGFGSK